jgi:hypothetical protein
LLLLSAFTCTLFACGGGGADEGSAGPSTATLDWNPVVHGSDPVTYRIYYGTTQGGPYLQSSGNGVDVGSVTTFTVSGLTKGARYFFVATAIATTESDFSNEVFKDIP